MAHISSDKIFQIKNGATKGVNFSDTEGKNCDSCVFGKLVKRPFYRSTKRASKLLELVHIDLCGFECLLIGGAKYMLVFLDDHSRMMFTYFWRVKSDTFKTFVLFKKFAKNFTDNKIKTLRSDNGGEYMFHQFGNFLDGCGIVHQTCVADNPSNGRAERAKRSAVELTCTMVHAANLPKSFWEETIATAVYAFNRIPKPVRMERRLMRSGRVQKRT